MEHIVKMAFDAPTKAEAEDNAIDLMEINNALSKADRKLLKQLLKQNPGIVQTAKKFLGK